MTRKLYISFLGTGNYSACKYQQGDYTSEEVRFIQEANLDYLYRFSKTFGKDDKVVFFVTDTANKLNWVDDGQKDRDGKTIKQTGLDNTIKALSEKVAEETGDSINYSLIRVCDTKEKNSLMSIFSTVYDTIDEGDELYLDITHSFRYLPMLLVVICNYAKLLKNVKVASITYGNFEGRDMALNIAQVEDLRQLTLIQDWTLAAGEFIKCGYAKDICDLAEKELRAIIKSGGLSDDIRSLRKGMAKIGGIVDDMTLCRGKDIIKGKGTEDAQKAFAQVGQVTIAPLQPIFEMLKNDVNELRSENKIMNGIYAAEWCYKHSLYQQAATAAEETVISHFCTGLKGYQGKEIELRNAVSGAIAIKQEYNGKEAEKGKRRTLAEIAVEVLANTASKDIEDFNNGRKDVRNDINHWGMRTQPSSAVSLKENLQKFIKACRNLCQIEVAEVTVEDFKPAIFINISNHPSDKWSKEQKEAAGCEIIDIPFPNVPAIADNEEIETIASDVVAEVTKQAETRKVTVHIMGEMTLTCSIVSKLKILNIDCVASTTNRIVVENPDGSKTSIFKFVKFRKY